MLDFESIYVDPDTGEIIAVNKQNKNEYEITKLETKKIFKGYGKCTIRTIYTCRENRQRRIEW